MPRAVVTASALPAQTASVHLFAPDTLWNTRYLDAAVAKLRAEGQEVKDEDVARLSPLKDSHVNFMGRYAFNFQSTSPDQGLRQLRDPDAPQDTDDEDEQ